MKSISSAIVILAGALIFSAGSLNPHGDTQLGICIVGALLGVLGLWAWIMTIGRHD